MSNFSRFMKENKKKKENGKFAPTKSLTDEKGQPLEFEFKHLSSKQVDDLRDSCTIDVQVTGNPSMYRPKVQTNKFTAKMICESVVYPDLYNAELQDSYGVKTPEELLYALVDNPGEYQNMSVWVQKFQGFEQSMGKKVDDAKN